MHRSVHVDRWRSEPIVVEERKCAGTQVGSEEDVGELNVVKARGFGGRKDFRQTVG
jgi:hypothetical protein